MYETWINYWRINCVCIVVLTVNLSIRESLATYLHQGLVVLVRSLDSLSDGEVLSNASELIVKIIERTLFLYRIVTYSRTLLKRTPLRLHLL